MMVQGDLHRAFEKLDMIYHRAVVISFLECAGLCISD